MTSGWSGKMGLFLQPYEPLEAITILMTSARFNQVSWWSHTRPKSPPVWTAGVPKQGNSPQMGT